MVSSTLVLSFDKWFASTSLTSVPHSCVRWCALRIPSAITANAITAEPPRITPQVTGLVNSPTAPVKPTVLAVAVSAPTATPSNAVTAPFDAPILPIAPNTLPNPLLSPPSKPVVLLIAPDTGEIAPINSPKYKMFFWTGSGKSANLEAKSATSSTNGTIKGSNF